MSDTSYYDSIANKEIKFRNYILNTFKDIFTKYPNKAHIHYFVLIRSYAQLNQRHMSWNYLKLYLKVMKFNLDGIARLFAGTMFVVLGNKINRLNIWN